MTADVIAHLGQFGNKLDAWRLATPQRGREPAREHAVGQLLQGFLATADMHH